MAETKIYIGDAAHVISKWIEPDSVQCVVTSPPYWNLRNYGVSGQLGNEETPEAYIEAMVRVFEEVRRVLRPDGTLWLNIGDSYNGSGGAGGDYRPGKWRDGQEKYGGGASPALKAKDLCMIPARLAMALQAAGWWLRSEIIWHKPNSMPESVKDRPVRSHEKVYLLTKSRNYYYDWLAVAEPVAEATRKDKRTVKGRHTDGRNKSKHHDNSIAEETKQDKPSWYRGRSATNPAGVRARRDVWSVTTKPFKGAHFAVMPPELAEVCIRAGTSEYGCCYVCGAPYERVAEKGDISYRDLGRRKRANAPGFETSDKSVFHTGTIRETRSVGWQAGCSCNAIRTSCLVLDPFMGVGTTALVASRLGQDAIGAEVNPEYAQLARERIEADSPLLNQVEVYDVMGERLAEGMEPGEVHRTLVDDHD